MVHLTLSSQLDFLTGVVILVFAVARISHLLAYEQGPFDIFERIRLLMGAKHLPFGEPPATRHNLIHRKQGDKLILLYSVPTNEFGMLLYCHWCNSLWVAAFVTGLWLLDWRWALTFCLPFAFSTCSIMLDGVFNHAGN